MTTEMNSNQSKNNTKDSNFVSDVDFAIAANLRLLPGAPSALNRVGLTETESA